ncbi:MAG: patatin-like phospholipase family protein, partial [Gammaproteobacteria bacterium]|nr:patatin-like phospholipase family protein [Gammaproteobacteria bacterium]
MKAFVIACLFPAAILTLAPAWSWSAGQSTDDQAHQSRPKIGLALSGGGARGAAHIGVIRELERLRVPIDYIAGTSMGAIVGGLYASGLSPDDLETILVEIDWDDIFRDRPDREHLSRRRKFDDTVFQVNKSVGVGLGGLKGTTGFVQGRKLELLLERVTAPVRDIEHFDDLPIPFRAVAANIVSGAEVVLEQGNLPAAIRASMSVPGLLVRVEIDGRLLVDGGMANNLPIDVVRRMGADVVIAVDISTPLQGEDELGSTFAIAAQLSGFLTRQNTEKQIATLTDKDVFMVPELGDIATASFTRAGEAVAIGQAAAVAATESLRRYELT